MERPSPSQSAEIIEGAVLGAMTILRLESGIHRELNGAGEAEKARRVPMTC
jgi:hypothetical protein